MPHEFTAATLTLPEVEPKVIVIEVLPAPEAILASPGTVQLYEVAPGMGLIE